LARVAAGSQNDGNPAMLIEYRLREIAGDCRLVVRVWGDDENVGFEAVVRRGRHAGLLRYGRSGKCRQAETRDQPQPRG
jgi:hypothetical protein